MLSVHAKQKSFQNTLLEFLTLLLIPFASESVNYWSHTESLKIPSTAIFWYNIKIFHQHKFERLRDNFSILRCFQAVRRLTLETRSFEGYYERLITGQLDMKWSGDDSVSGGRGGGHKRASQASVATIISDSTPESDSVRTSLVDLR